jgi:AcrR family transcriptional regulator
MIRKAKTPRLDVREQILCQATRLFGQRGFGGVALRDIAKASGIPLSTLSSHFARKRSLQVAVIERAIDYIIKSNLNAQLTHGSPQTRFRRYLVNLVELFLSDVPEIKVLDREFQELDKASTFDRVVRVAQDRRATESMMSIAELAKNTKSDILKLIPAVQLTHMLFAAIYGMVKLRSLDRRVIEGKRVSNADLTRDIVIMCERILRVKADKAVH